MCSDGSRSSSRNNDANSSCSGGSSIHRRALTGMLYSLLLRTLSFLLTIATKRFVSAETLGRADVTLDLLMGTCLWIGREGFRLALGRGSSSTSASASASASATGKQESKNDTSQQQSDQQHIINSSYLSVPFGILCSAIGLMLHLHHCNKSMTSLASFNTALDGMTTAERDYLLGGILYVSASLLESLSEPYQLQALRTMDVDTRAGAEGCGSLGRAIMNVFLLGGSADRIHMLTKGNDPNSWNFATDYPVCCFGIGHVTHAVLLGIVFRWRNRSEQKKIQGVQFVGTKNTYFDIPALRLTAIFTFQSVFKHALTEGDRIVLTLLGNDRERGVYGMASSIGGIASRMLLQPVEENARLLFGQLGSDVTASASDDEKKRRINNLEKTYTTLIKLVLYFGLVFASLGSNYTSILLRILAGNQWGSNEDATAALSAFCIYTALLALNGTTEAFVYGTARSYIDVGALSTVHGVVTAVAFGGAAPLLVGEYGTVGLVAANCLAMALRSTYSIYFASNYLCRAASSDKERPKPRTIAQKMYQLLFRGILPKTMVLALFTATYFITNRTRIELLTYENQLSASGVIIRLASKDWLLAASKHIAVGVVCLFVTAAAAYKMEKDLRRDVKAIVGEKAD